MEFDKLREALKPRLRDYVESITEKSKGGLYICPLCGSGTGRSHTGAFSIDSKDPTRWKCFSCGKSGDLFDLIGEVEHIAEPLAQLQRAGELYGIDTDRRPQAGGQKMDGHTEQKHSQISYYRECQKHLAETDYLAKRGISTATATRFMLGYDAHYTRGTGRTEWKALIIPTGEYSYVARNTDPQAEEKDRYRKTGNALPINAKALQTATKPVFIVEGELDALSIIEAGGEAVGLGSTANIPSFISNYLKKQKPAQPLVLALDNDEAGQRATDELAHALDELGLAYYRLDPYNGQKDANSALLADREAFTQAVAQAEHLEEEAENAERDLYLRDRVDYHLQEFIDGIAESANTPATPTGFPALDKVLDGGLYEGLYILGAISSLGKTTYAMQIADQIAQGGHDVLIIALEMSRAELMSKSISRHTLLNVLANNGDIRNAKTSRGITAGARYAGYSETEKALIRQAVSEYETYAKHLYIHEGHGDIGTAYIRDIVQKHIRFTGQRPIVLVDYLQILAPRDVRATDKQNMDTAVRELKQISRDYKTPIIAISSFNRDNYDTEVNMSSFKESGAIEYSCDVLIGLQLKGAGSKDFDSNEAKKKDPREVELVTLKQRLAPTGNKISYQYFPRFNYFKEVGTEDEGRGGRK